MNEERDPCGMWAGIATFVSVVMLLLAVFTVDLPLTQHSTIMHVLAVLGPAVGPLWVMLARRHAWAPSAVEVEVERARQQGILEGQARAGAAEPPT